MNYFNWLPPIENESFREQLKSQAPGHCIKLSRHNLSFIQQIKLSSWLLKSPELNFLPKLRIALLSSCTVDHLIPHIRVGCLRRSLLPDFYVAPFNQYRNEILDKQSALYAFNPDFIFLAIDHYEITSRIHIADSVEEINAFVDSYVDDLRTLWKVLKSKLRCQIIQQQFFSLGRRSFGHFESLVPAAPSTVLTKINFALCTAAAEDSILVFDQNYSGATLGTDVWHSTAHWNSYRQEINPVAAPVFGEQFSRILAASRGLSKKCLVLDLDNTCWGGVIGDDGLEGIKLGAGDPDGEAYSNFHQYLVDLKNRGIVLAVSSKNDEKIAQEVFLRHPGSILKLDDFSCFVANWNDKASNIEYIAEELNIGIDSIVFFDDNPVERAYIRFKLPKVDVPEVPEYPSEFVNLLVNAGYFEAANFSKEDLSRSSQYFANAKRKALVKISYDIGSFLKGLEMKASIVDIQKNDFARVVQLVNKSNQFNLTTKRYSQEQITAFANNNDCIALHANLTDIFGDNGIVSVCILVPFEQDAFLIDTWVMSCRVLGRNLEKEMLNQVVNKVEALKKKRIVGEYIVTEKNGIVKDHYKNLGFSLNEKSSENKTVWTLEINQYTQLESYIETL